MTSPSHCGTDSEQGEGDGGSWDGEAVGWAGDGLGTGELAGQRPLKFFFSGRFRPFPGVFKITPPNSGNFVNPDTPRHDLVQMNG